jgi:putative transposase
LDSQSVKTSSVAGERGFDGAKLVMGRKRHISVDVMGLILVVLVHKTSIQERDGAKLLLQRAKDKRFQYLCLIWTDGGYRGQPMLDWVFNLAGWMFEIVKRSDDVKGFQVLPYHWIVERMFAWLGRYRRLSKDYEVLPQTREALVYAAMVNLMLTRLARNPAVYL